MKENRLLCLLMFLRAVKLDSTVLDCLFALRNDEPSGPALLVGRSYKSSCVALWHLSYSSVMAWLSLLTSVCHWDKRGSKEHPFRKDFSFAGPEVSE